MEFLISFHESGRQRASRNIVLRGFMAAESPPCKRWCFVTETSAIVGVLHPSCRSGVVFLSAHIRNCNWRKIAIVFMDGFFLPPTPCGEFFLKWLRVLDAAAQLWQACRHRQPPWTATLTPLIRTS